MNPATAARRRIQVSEVLALIGDVERTIRWQKVLQYWPELTAVLDRFVVDVTMVAEARLSEINEEPPLCVCRCHPPLQHDEASA